MESHPPKGLTVNGKLHKHRARRTGCRLLHSHRQVWLVVCHDVMGAVGCMPVVCVKSAQHTPGTLASASAQCPLQWHTRQRT